MKNLADFLLDSAHSGVYAAPAPVNALRQSALGCGLAWFELDLADVDGKAAYLARCQTVFALPPSFGHNWDALADCLQDLAWQPSRGYVVHCRNGAEFARSSPPDFALALEIFTTAAAYWLEQRKTFVVLVDADTRGHRELKRMPA